MAIFATGEGTHENKIHMVLGKDWPPGVVGLAAGKIVNTFARPAIVASDFHGSIIGSGRSIEGFDLIAALHELGDRWFYKYGGHPMACGFTLASGVLFEEFQNELTKLVNARLSDEDVLPRLHIDARLSLHDISWKLFDELQLLEPFGQKNPQPNFALFHLKLHEIMSVGSDKKHLRIKVVSEDGKIVVSGIAFGFGSLADTLVVGDRIDCVAHLDRNEWNGHRELQLKIIDVKKSQEGE